MYHTKKQAQKQVILAAALALNTTLSVADEDGDKRKNESVKPENAKVLDVITVKAKSASDVDSYQATKTRVGKVLQDPHDIPQAVTTITKSLMHDQQVDSLKDALRNVSGLTFNAAEGGRSGDNMNLRGFYTFGDIYLDGMRDTAQYNRETFNLEQVDVLRGSAAMLFGRGQAGGVINQVSKTAELEDENAINAGLGTHGYHQVTGDFNKKISESTAIRVNVLDRKEENYRENPATGEGPELRRKGIAVSFGTGIGTDNELFLNHIYTQTRDIPDYGVSFFNKRPINKANINDKTFYGGDKNFDDSDTRISTAIFTHKFSNDTQLRTQIRNADYERAYWTKTPNATILPNANLSVGGNPTRVMDYETLSLQSDLSTKLTLAGMPHQVLTGVEYLKENSYRQALRNIGNASNPDYTRSQVTGVANRFKANNYAVYLQDTIEFIPQWNLLLGVRRDEMRANYSSVTSPKLNYGENSYRAGLSWQPTSENHYYLSWSDSFSPTADLYQLTVAPLPPERSQTVELGSKWLWLNGDLAFRTALYQTIKEWERNTDLESTAAILTKKRRTNGLELELAGRISESWEVFAGLALMDAKIMKVAENIDATTGIITTADKRLTGVQARNTPKLTLNLWTTYKIDSHWKVAGGLEAKGERYGYLPSTTNANSVFTNGRFDPNTVPGFVRLDAMLAYEEKEWAIRLNLKNLLDKTYYDAIYDNGGFSVPANSRTAILITELKF